MARGENGQKQGQMREKNQWRENHGGAWMSFTKVLAFTWSEIGRHWVFLSRANLQCVFFPCIEQLINSDLEIASDPTG